MEILLSQLLFSISVTGPICIMLFLGMFFKRIQLIDDRFIEIASKLVFKVTLPTLLFLSIIGSNHNFLQGGKLILFGVVGNFIYFLLALGTVRKLFPSSPDKGVLVQGAFRGNTAIVALAYIANAYGNDGIAQAALYVAAVTMLFNIQAVLILSPSGEKKGLSTVLMLLKNIIKNPLIISIILGLIFAQLPFTLPNILLKTGHYFANMTLPMALICSGGALDLKKLMQNQSTTWFSASSKLILCPLLLTGSAILLGFRGVELGIILLCASAPAAASSYVMVRAMGKNHVLAANIIVITTIASLFTTTLGVFLLTRYGLI